MLSALLFVSVIEAAAPTTELWAGHQVVLGEREVPVLGSVQTRLETFVLARVRRGPGGGLTLEEHACATRFAPVLGVEVTMPPLLVARLRSTSVRYMPLGADLTAGPWDVGWSEDDIEGDGLPGATIHVDAPLCSGDVYVASRSTSRARSQLTPDGMRGTVEIRVAQRRLGASTWCLTLGDAVTDEAQRGAFVYRRVEPSSTCASFSLNDWPAHVASPAVPEATP